EKKKKEKKRKTHILKAKVTLTFREVIPNGFLKFAWSQSHHNHNVFLLSCNCLAAIIPSLAGILLTIPFCCSLTCYSIEPQRETILSPLLTTTYHHFTRRPFCLRGFPPCLRDYFKPS